MDRKILISGLVLFVAAIAAAGAWRSGLFSEKYSGDMANGKVAVVASFYPLAEFAGQVGGENVEVRNITPGGTEPHDYEPSPRDIAAAYDADLFIMNGSGIDSWAEKIRPQLESEGVRVVNMTEYLNSRTSVLSSDPHFWLSPVLAGMESDAIFEALSEIDPVRREQYRGNLDHYRNTLLSLDLEYRQGLSQCQSREIVTSHNAFYYLAREYGLETFYILGLSPDEEPSPKTIAAVAEQARQKNIEYIFFESLASPKLSESIAREIGAQTLELNPIEGFSAEEIAAGKNYISQMQLNLNNLKIALKCQ